MMRPWEFLTFLAWSAGILSLIGFIVAVVAWASYSARFAGSWLGSDSTMEQWVRFSGAVMPMLQTLIAFATLVAAAYIGLTINMPQVRPRARKAAGGRSPNDRASRSPGSPPGSDAAPRARNGWRAAEARGGHARSPRRPRRRGTSRPAGGRNERRPCAAQSRRVGNVPHEIGAPSPTA